MASRQQFLSRYPAVGYNTHESRHEQSHHSLHGVEITNFISHAGAEQVGTHGDEIGSPYTELQETHPYQPAFHVVGRCIHGFLIA